MTIGDSIVCARGGIELADDDDDDDDDYDDDDNDDDKNDAGRR